MIANLHITALAATLSALALAVPAGAADGNAGYSGHIPRIKSFEEVEVIRAGGRHGGRNEHWRGGRDRHFVHRPRHLTPWEVRFRLRRRGFRHMHFVDRWAPVYKLRAIGPGGRRVFLVVSSRSGRIIDRHPVRRHHWR